MDPKDAHICALLYGDHPALHKRIISSFLDHVPEQLPISLWCNQVCESSKKLLTSRFNDIIFCDDNVPKYKVMRLMFERFKKPDACTWCNWFDEDSHIIDHGWFERTSEFIDKTPSAVYIGQPWFVHNLPGQDEFISKATWYKGKPFEQLKGKPIVSFLQGAYWWLRTDVLRQLDWPDPRLVHNGGDTLLGEAIRQQGFHLHKFTFGVKINDAPRRGYSEAPAGSLNLNARR